MKTALYDRHVALNAKIVPFAGWEMPVHYQGVLAEHLAVRNQVGLFDVSHMGRIEVQGPDAERLLDFLSTNRIQGKRAGTATYTVWARSDGGSVDDVIVYKIDDTHFFVVVNAGNRDKDLQHLKAYAKQLNCNVVIQELYDQFGILALQGPSSLPLLSLSIPEVVSLKSMHFLATKEGMFISRTGYTGALGFELYGTANQIRAWWDRLMYEGAPYAIQPVGLGARDTLRLEMGFALYGHELSDQIAPNESVSAWTVKWDKPAFLGKEALEKLENGSRRRAYGFVLLDEGIARQHAPVFENGALIGEVTSGSYSPGLELGIGLILVNIPLQLGQEITIKVRQNFCRAQVVKLPFIVI